MWEVAGTAQEIAPSVTHAAILRDPTIVAGIGQFAVIQAVAPSAGIEVSPIDLRGPDQIERAIATFAQSPNGGIIMTASGIGAANVNLIIAAAARYKLPAVYQRSLPRGDIGQQNSARRRLIRQQQQKSD